jgi:hypothetical protein
MNPYAPEAVEFLKSMGDTKIGTFEDEDDEMDYIYDTYTSKHCKKGTEQSPYRFADDYFGIVLFNKSNEGDYIPNGEISAEDLMRRSIEIAIKFGKDLSEVKLYYGTYSS